MGMSSSYVWHGKRWVLSNSIHDSVFWSYDRHELSHDMKKRIMDEGIAAVSLVYLCRGKGRI